jgi:hypothetical protein
MPEMRDGGPAGRIYSGALGDGPRAAEPVDQYGPEKYIGFANERYISVEYQ